MIGYGWTQFNVWPVGSNVHLLAFDSTSNDSMDRLIEYNNDEGVVRRSVYFRKVRLAARLNRVQETTRMEAKTKKSWKPRGISTECSRED